MNKPICFIPARGGSKRIPAKNKRLFCGRPIIEYPISAARESGLFRSIIVSSDDPEILSIAGKLGCQLDSRPEHLYSDDIDTESIAAYIIKEYHLEADDVFCMMYATAAFVKPEWLIDSLSQFDGLPIAVCKETQHPAQRALFKGTMGYLEPIDESSICMRTQDLPHTLFDVGDFYWFRPIRFLALWEQHIDLLRQLCTPFIVGKYDTWDIDDPEDWEHAEAEYMRLNAVNTR